MGQGYGKHHETGDRANRARNPGLHEVDNTRRHVFKCTGAAIAMLVGSHALGASAATGKPLGFTSVPVSGADTVSVPVEYEAQVLYRWGDAVGAVAGSPTFKTDGSNTWEEQALQAGMHHDGMAFFPIDGNPRHGLLAINHEYTDDGLLHADGMLSWSADKVRKSQAAHGVSIIEILERQGQWRVMPKSRYARRLTASTPLALSGPARGHDLLKTAADPTGTRSLGTLNNCAAGQTPWGSYLSCEENWNAYFSARAQPNADAQRYGLRPQGGGYRWHEHDERFDAAKHPNEPHRFGWVVEVDPMDPAQTPVKRTALGRLKHAGAVTTLARDGRVVVYMADDERFEYIYKFVSRDKVKPGGYQANKDLLDHGILYVARFEPQGHGRWLALTQGENGLTAERGFPSQAEILIKTRQAADVAGATPMDRPEWIAVHPQTGEVFATLTNNSQRGQPAWGVDDATPRADNIMGHIIRWREGSVQGSDAAAAEFRWMHFALAGDPNAVKAEHQGACQQTGNNMMLCADPDTGETKRFLTGPVGCEITGVTFTSDRRAVFINIQHPGETAGERSDPAKRNWPDGPDGGRPRSATVVISRKDGGVVGT